MSNYGKKYKKALESVNKNVSYSISEGLKKVKELAYAKFDESVDININLGIDPSKGDQAVRGSVVLPHSLGKIPKVIVFAKGDHATEAEKAGADFVGADDLIEKVESGWTDFDYAVATPDLMGLVGKVAKILGPKGLLPNKKNGTVTFETGTIVNDLKKGRQFFKNDKNGLIHFTFGRVSFNVEKLIDNLNTFVKALYAAKPASAKGKYIKKATAASTMGVGIRLNQDELQV